MSVEPVGRTALRSSAVLAFSVLSAGCRVITGACDYEVRTAWATETLVENGTEIVRVEGSAGERRGSSHSKAFSWLVVSPALSGHVKSVILVQASQPELVLLRLASFQSGTIPTTTAFGGFVEERPGLKDQPMTGIFEIIANGRGILVIATDLASRPIVSMPLTVRAKRGWYTPDCQHWDDPSLQD